MPVQFVNAVYFNRILGDANLGGAFGVHNLPRFNFNLSDTLKVTFFTCLTPKARCLTS